ncbi:serine hydrolase domain-containing protein [Modestobacter roseus]|uniref:CubicO group peptidase (Beta-lactamase class C family) n=1 Tax=Modestobacter roseus TaxID=1181884 RepID=A0A562IUW2_9ACTN|nr:serine hydrolase [Modestobacter roseus]MQA33555.1 serine hydrolase [Modestobacter roseus]TWH74811.1 CubicO group peptidase (beta-lactamase class C family) [Modestobacter roseus]
MGVHEAVRRFGRISADRGLRVHGLVVHQRGAAAVDEHWDLDLRRDVFSASKTVTALAVGLAEAEGLLSRDDPVLRHLPQLAARAAPGVELVTVDSLLRMTSGLTWRWAAPDADHPGDPAVDVLAGRPVATPGSVFRYRGGSTYLLSRVIHACSGVDLRDFLVPRLFTPLGIANPQWHRCPLGHSLGAVGLCLRTSELAAFGRLLLDSGRWHDHQLVPPDFVSALTSDPVDTDGHVATGAPGPHPDNARYGRGVWLCARDDAWRMDGIHGQVSVVLPRHDACVTVTAGYPGPTSDVLDALWSVVVPALG